MILYISANPPPSRLETHVWPNSCVDHVSCQVYVLVPDVPSCIPTVLAYDRRGLYGRMTFK
jgi:hypothetical protein